MAAHTAWYLNLDAEHELADPDGYTPSAAVLAQVAHQARRVVGLVGPGDCRLGQQSHPGCAAGALGRAWCPTPRALAALARAGARPPAAPELEVLQRVNHRRFAWELFPGPLGAEFVDSPEAAVAILGEPSASVAWVAKRAFGFAGRGRRRFFEPPNTAERRWIERSCVRGHGLLIEPWVAREGDYSLHGWIEPGGTVVLGRPLGQLCDAHGVWQDVWQGVSQGAVSEPGELALRSHEMTALMDAGQLAGRGLYRAGYVGPFGIDGFAYRRQDGKRAFHPMVEINARYTMAWGLSGLSPQREE